MGLERAGWRVVYANDYAQEKYEMYRDAFPGEAELYEVEDIFNLDAKSIPLATLATSSFPCIDLSLAGKGAGIQGKHSSAFWGLISILEEQGEEAPPLVMLENVTGWLYSNKGEDFRITIEALNELGYTCDVFELDARRFTPQSRPRIFVIGTRHRPPQHDVTPLLVRSKALASTRIKDAVATHFDLDWSFLDIPEPPRLLNEGLTSRIVEHVPDKDPRWWPQEEVTRHLEMMRTSHRERVNSLAGKDYFSYRTIYRRMRSGQQRAEVRQNDTAGCLRTARGGSSRQIVVCAGKGQIRMRHMTPREYARLQGVPDSYPINVDDLQALTGFGDAVCVDVIEWIARNVLAPLIEELATLEEAPIGILGQLT